MRRCGSCGEEKPLNEFPFQKKRNSYSSWCKLCGNAYRRNRQIEVFNEIASIKTEKGCELCGYSKPSAALHFDHIDPSEKYMQISTMISQMKSKELIYKEIEKCRVLCANCHAEVTWENRHGGD